MHIVLPARIEQLNGGAAGHVKRLEEYAVRRFPKT